MAFIEKLDGPALNLSPEEFEGYMLGHRAPSALKKRQQVASHTQHLLEELKGRQEKLDQGVGDLNVQLKKWVQAVHSQLDDATTQFALVQKEITAQAEFSPAATQDAPLQRDDKEPSAQLLKD